MQLKVSPGGNKRMEPVLLTIFPTEKKIYISFYKSIHES